MKLKALFSHPIHLSFQLIVWSAVVFFTFHRPGPLPADEKEISWMPKVSCEQAWHGENLFRYNYETDKVAIPEYPGNFGYDTFVKRVESSSGVKRKDCFKDWTVLVYMAANNDLTPYAYWDLYEMESSYSLERAASTLNTDLLVDLQLYGQNRSHRMHIFQSDNEFNKNKAKEEFSKMTLDEIQSPIVSIQDRDQSSPEEHLYEFVEWGVKNYPAKNYMLVVWGHGQGWAPDEFLDQPSPFDGKFGGLAFQYYSQEYLTTPALARVLKKTSQQVFEGLDQIDVYASDACLMQQLEVAHEIAPFTRYVVGSTQIQTYLGLPYRRMLYEINRGCFNTREDGHPYCGDNAGVPGKAAQVPQKLIQHCGEDEACYLAKMIPHLTRQSFSSPEHSLQYPGDPKAIEFLTISSINTYSLEHYLVTHLDSLGRLLSEFMENISFEDREEFLDTLKSLETYPGDAREWTIALAFFERYFSDRNTQLSFEIVNKIREMDAWLSETVVDFAFGTYYVEKNYHLIPAKNLSLWIPSSPEVLMSRLEDYQNSRLYYDLQRQGNGENHWLLWMKHLHFPKELPPLSI